MASLHKCLIVLFRVEKGYQVRLGLASLHKSFIGLFRVENGYLVRLGFKAIKVILPCFDFHPSHLTQNQLLIIISSYFYFSSFLWKKALLNLQKIAVMAFIAKNIFFIFLSFLLKSKVLYKKCKLH